MINKNFFRLVALLSFALLGKAVSVAGDNGVEAKAKVLATFVSQEKDIKDYNADGRKSVGDITYFLENSMEVKPGTGDAVADAPVRHAAAATSTDVTGQYSNKSLRVELSQAKNFVAFQIDIVVGGSASVTSATATISSSLQNAGFQLFYNYIAAKKKLRVLAYHPQNTAYSGVAGTTLFNALFTATSLSNSDLTFSDVLFVLNTDVTKDVTGSGTIVEGEAKTGDVNRDGDLDASDIVAILDIMKEQNLSLYDLNAADANGDQEIDVTDIVYIIGLMKQ